PLPYLAQLRWWELCQLLYETFCCRSHRRKLRCNEDFGKQNLTNSHESGRAFARLAWLTAGLHGGDRFSPRYLSGYALQLKKRKSSRCRSRSRPARRAMASTKRKPPTCAHHAPPPKVWPRAARVKAPL